MFAKTFTVAGEAAAKPNKKPDEQRYMRKFDRMSSYGFYHLSAGARPVTFRAHIKRQCSGLTKGFLEARVDASLGHDEGIVDPAAS